MIVEHVQRWELGRLRWRSARTAIDPSEFDVAPLPYLDARAFVELHHYARSCSPAARPFGLWRRGALVGAACFGPLASAAAHRAVFGEMSPTVAFSLGRLVLLDDVAANGESWFVARCFEQLAVAGVIAIESCADPVERRIGEQLVKPGHVGTIYQATNGHYVGRTNASTLHVLPDGAILSNRAQSKLSRGERGAGTAERLLVAAGAEPRGGEDALVWLQHWRARLCRTLRHPGNHRYLWCLDRCRRREVLRAPARPYPKIC